MRPSLPFQSHRLSTLLSAAAVASATTAAAADGLPAFDLSTDFSDASNPAGAWSFQHGETLLPHVDAWQSSLGGWGQPQPAWARSENGIDRLPVLFRSNGSEGFGHDWNAGAIVVHSTDPSNGAGAGIATFAFTAPQGGVLDVTGETWIGRDIGRANSWRVLRGTTVLAAGMTSSGDAYSSANPFHFVDGEVTPGALSGIEVCAGETISLQIERAHQFGDFSVVQMQVTYTLLYPACTADLDGDCQVSGSDLGMLLSNWGGGGGGDLDGSGAVDGADLGMLLSAWGGCPIE